MPKVKCEFCTKFEGGKCKSKGVSVEPRKARLCGKYVSDTAAIIKDERIKMKIEQEIPLYKQTHRFYSGEEGAEYVLSNPRTAKVPEKLLRLLKAKNAVRE